MDRLYRHGAPCAWTTTPRSARTSRLVVYPKLSASYVISDEPFFSFPLVDQLKLRAAWGQAGNAPDPFTADRTLGPGLAVVGDVPSNELAFDEYGNPDLKAETGQEIELGFDASLLEGRMGVEFTFYDKTTKDALIAIPDPRSAGYEGTHLTSTSARSRTAGSSCSSPATPSPALRAVGRVARALHEHNELISFGTEPPTRSSSAPSPTCRSTSRATPWVASGPPTWSATPAGTRCSTPAGTSSSPTRCEYVGPSHA